MSHPDAFTLQGTNDPPLGPPPRHLSKPERMAWKEIALMAAPGRLTARHRLWVELLAGLVVFVRANGVENVSGTHLATLHRMLSKLAANDADAMDAAMVFMGSAAAPAKPSRQ